MTDIIERLQSEIERTVKLDMMHQEAANEIASLRAKVAAMEDDAKRYLWLRDVSDATYRSLQDQWRMTAIQCDATIDAAMKDKP